MKKNVIKIIFLVFVVAIIIGGKKYIDNKTYPYKEIVDQSMTSYLLGGTTDDLDPIVSLLDKYTDDATMKSNIQSYCYAILGSWYTYLDGKYLCDKSNLNSCKVQLEEFNSLNTKLLNLYNVKSEEGYTIIVTSAYNNLKSEGEKKISGLEKIVASPSAKNPLSSEEQRLQKCMVAVDCESCRDGICKCYYLDENKNREALTCKKDIAN